MKAPAAVDATYEYLGTKKCRMCHTKQYKSLLESPKGHSWDALMPGVRIRARITCSFGTAVILSAAKNLAVIAGEILRCAQDDDKENGQVISARILSQQAKIRAGLDVNTDYRTDGRCLKCHSVGYGKPGGYVVPTPNDRRSERLAAKREGVGCESCHGPGSGFVQIMRDIWENERKYKIEELRAKGRKTVGPEVCSNCHNDQAICMVGVDAHEAGTNGANGSQAKRSWLRVDVTDRHGFHAKFPLKYRASEGAAREDLPKERSSANGKPSDSLKGKNK